VLNESVAGQTVCVNALVAFLSATKATCSPRIALITFHVSSFSPQCQWCTSVHDNDSGVCGVGQSCSNPSELAMC